MPTRANNAALFTLTVEIIRPNHLLGQRATDSAATHPTALPEVGMGYSVHRQAFQAKGQPAEGIRFN